MLTNQLKQKLLQRFTKKEERLVISNILDKAFRYEKTGKVEYTNFLNMSQIEQAKIVLNQAGIEYHIYKLSEDSSKSVIFFVPEYIEFNTEFVSNYISVIKIVPKDKTKLKHRDYLGAIFSLGIEHDVIGDLFIVDGIAYCSFTKNIEEYILNNFFRVGNLEVEVISLKLDSNELENIKLEYNEKNIIVPSLRIDAIVAEIYNISRAEAKQNITSGGLYINDKNIITPDIKLVSNDIVSLRHFGKFKFSDVISETRSGNYRLLVKLYK